MNKNKIKYLLSNKVYIIAEIEDLQLQINELESRESVSIQGVSYEERTQSSTISNTTEQQAISNMSKTMDLKEEQLTLVTQLKRLNRGMEVLEEIEFKILTEKFIDNCKWETVIKKHRKETKYNIKYLADRAILKLSKVMK